MLSSELAGWDADKAFGFYESVRAVLPRARYPATPTCAPDLGPVAERYDVFVFDAFGVLNVGETPIKGARERIDQLRELGKSVFVMTNGASFSAEASMEKFRKFGFDFTENEIVSSRSATLSTIGSFGDLDGWHVITTERDDAADFGQLEPIGEVADDLDEAEGFLFLSSARWSEPKQAMLEASLMRRKRPVVVGNPDAVAPREYGLSLEPGYYGHRIAQRCGIDVAFHGKPFPSIYDVLESRISPDIQPSRVVMMGDTLHTDVLGAAACGWGSVLVASHGLFRGLGVESYITASGIVPDWIVPSI
ncbi:HAD-IIA family hydrolase [Stappia sp. GBMRC 2046]|uniref:HAD-IIA family hydrolase n=1 Tax=Stappia sediminis TaxID=2692190 RepID=A0A7X3LUV9_9HYPH|nr:HAD-IIA family hydrolase [Stappia sediminis]MXN65524.1 HAD-IIA family hydrolase [Stappia sediminis]